MIDLDKIEWRPIKDWPYEVSEYGHVRRTGKAEGATIGKILKGTIDRDGYLKFALSKNGKNKGFFSHYLVITTFVGEKPTNKTEVAHWDDDKNNNHYKNLRWATSKENKEDAKRNNKAKYIAHFGEDNKRSKLTKEKVVEIRDRFSKNEEIKMIAKSFNLSWATIWCVVTNRTWRNI